MVGGEGEGGTLVLLLANSRMNHFLKLDPLSFRLLLSSRSHFRESLTRSWDPFSNFESHKKLGSFFQFFSKTVLVE
jgi:hypothetical protein